MRYDRRRAKIHRDDKISAAVSLFNLYDLRGSASSADHYRSLIVGILQYMWEFLENAIAGLQDIRIHLLADGMIQALMIGGMVLNGRRRHLQIEFLDERVEFEGLRPTFFGH